MSWKEEVRNDFIEGGKPELESIDDFWVYCGNLNTAFPEWRTGQTIFNALCRARSDLANQVGCTDLDTYYDDGRISAFSDWLKANWIERQPVLITKAEREILVDALFTASHQVMELGSEYFKIHELIDKLYEVDYSDD